MFTVSFFVFLLCFHCELRPSGILHVLIWPSEQFEFETPELEADVPNLAEVFQLYSKVRIGMMENIETIPLIEGEQENIATILDTRENFCIKMIHKSAYFLDSRYHGELLSDENKLAAIQFV